ncbi:DUF222 domain-containing protein [Sinomonas sp. ASV322]|uniref:HNH endonuclease signature motif containing protein n=1 Tax=Sinomonas sp. ASV322 TaxID=3041920 RepID=UPI0027DD8EC3|nr:DUF222 domain-containing protein [Sinomonas sp. ASV322]MDQ4502397.1 DUF222 domain-containing protein [Sinomonas sp. ASV322]
MAADVDSSTSGAWRARPETSGAVILVPRPGSLLEGSLWHPDPSTLSGEDARRALADIGRARSFLAALEALAVERIRLASEEEAREVAARAHSESQAERFGGDVGRALAVSEVAVAEGISEFAAARLVNSSEALCGPQQAVLSWLEGGVLSEAHARVITDETSTLPEAVAEEFGIECLRRLETRTGRRRTPGEFRKAVRALRERLHPDSIRARRVRAERDRGVWIRPEPDGMCTLTAFLPAELGLAAYNRVDAIARSRRDTESGEGRTLPQLRADELAGLLLVNNGGSSEHSNRSIEHSNGSTARERDSARIGREVTQADVPRPAAEVVVHVSAESLLGLAEEPGELEGYGPIDAETARALAVDAPTWQLLSTGENGVPLSLGRTAYRPPKRLRRFIEYRDGSCQFPGCLSPASKAEIDHIAEWQDGGTTDAANLQALCRKHHALKSLHLWKPTRLETDGGAWDGDVLWVSPLGTRVLAGPADRELVSTSEKGLAPPKSQQLGGADSSGLRPAKSPQLGPSDPPPF